MKKPEVYLDMDGVIADFFTEYAKLAGVTHGNYRDIPPAKVDPTLNKMVGTDFFFRLPKFPTADALVDMIVKTFGHYHICSSPLRGDHAGSEKYKRAWISKNLKQAPTDIIITPNKAKFAKQQDGTPNILIDDRGSNISAWEAAGGIGIKYQADEDGLDVVVAGFKRAMQIIKGEQDHVPQKLTSLDRGKMIAVQKSGDQDEEDVIPKTDVKEATEGATTSNMNAGLGASPHVAAGTPAVIKRWSGSPGKMGKSIKHKPVKSQSAKDNPVTNRKVGGSLIA